MRVLFRWSVNAGRGEIKVFFRFRSSGAPLVERAQAAALMVAAHRPGRTRIIDRSGQRDALEQSNLESRLQPGLEALAGLFAALAEIEQFAGSPVPEIPDEVTYAETNALIRTADVLRAGGQIYRVKSVALTGDADWVNKMRRAGSDIEVGETVVASIFGTKVPIAERRIKLPLMQITAAERLPSAEWKVTMKPAMSPEVEVWAEFRPLPPEAEALEAHSS